MLTGNLPYRATTMTDIINAHLHHPPEPIPLSIPISNETRELIEWMLQKDVKDRPPSATPVLERIDQLLKSATTSRSASRRATVLVVEQDQETSTMIRTVLEEQGWRVSLASNARDAVNMAFEQTPSLIFLDARIRGGFEVAAADDQEQVADGLGFVRVLHADEKLRGVPIIVVTDQTLSQFDEAFTKAGIADVMLKPLDRDDVLDALKRAT
jgi:CheY-like chemotaxis protein